MEQKSCQVARGRDEADHEEGHEEEHEEEHEGAVGDGSWVHVCSG